MEENIRYHNNYRNYNAHGIEINSNESELSTKSRLEAIQNNLNKIKEKFNSGLIGVTSNKLQMSNNSNQIDSTISNHYHDDKLYNGLEENEDDYDYLSVKISTNENKSANADNNRYKCDKTMYKKSQNDTKNACYRNHNYNTELDKPEYINKKLNSIIDKYSYENTKIKSNAPKNFGIDNKDNYDCILDHITSKYLNYYSCTAKDNNNEMSQYKTKARTRNTIEDIFNRYEKNNENKDINNIKDRNNNVIGNKIKIENDDLIQKQLELLKKKYLTETNDKAELNKVEFQDIKKEKETNTDENNYIEKISINKNNLKHNKKINDNDKELYSIEDKKSLEINKIIDKYKTSSFDNDYAKEAMTIKDLEVDIYNIPPSISHNFDNITTKTSMNDINNENCNAIPNDNMSNRIINIERKFDLYKSQNSPKSLYNKNINSLKQSSISDNTKIIRSANNNGIRKNENDRFSKTNSFTNSSINTRNSYSYNIIKSKNIEKSLNKIINKSSNSRFNSWIPFVPKTKSNKKNKVNEILNKLIKDSSYLLFDFDIKKYNNEDNINENENSNKSNETTKEIGINFDNQNKYYINNNNNDMNYNDKNTTCIKNYLNSDIDEKLNQLKNKYTIVEDINKNSKEETNENKNLILIQEQEYEKNNQMKQQDIIYNKECERLDYGNIKMKKIKLFTTTKRSKK